MEKLDCGNFKPTINPCLQDLSLPQIHIDDILAKLSGNKAFTTLDLPAAYNQMEVDSSHRDLLTIATTKGLYRFKRLASKQPQLFGNTIKNKF